ncbi:MAG TPA: protein kinase [Bryobacteraceae bacterium]|jgi:serine/threonine-protein kinase
MALSVGERLGPYVIAAKIGVGGMGEVWKARDTRLDRIVAIKRLKGDHGARFEQEARAIAALNHPHICQIHDIGEDYLVLEYIEGSPLRGPLPLPDALRIAAQIASALEAAHSKGILHRDLKPGNILVSGSGAKLLDFGLAKVAGDEDATQSMAVSGTPLYMSPEQAEGKALDARSDIFSFGSVLYELLAGRRAFESLAAVLRDDPAPFDSPALEVVAKCLKKNPPERYQSMTEVRAALESVVAQGADQQPSIAVLPFANLSGDKEQEYFSDGLAEEIINALAQIPGLKVTARTSAFAFRGKEQDITKIAEVLRVRTILEGSVRRAGNRIRVTAQLINAADGYHLWSQRYDRELADVFEVQDEIAAAIAGALQAKLAPKPAAVERYKPNLPAYEAYLKGLHQFQKLTLASMTQGKEYFERAILLDPKFAPPYGEVATYYSWQAGLVLRPSSEVMPHVQEWAQKALEIDPSLSEAHALLAYKAFLFDYDWNEAERRFSLALSRAPAPAWTCRTYTLYKVSLGRAGEAEELIRDLVEADPLAALNRVYLAWICETTGRAQEAEQEFRHILELDENYYFGWSGLGRLLFARGETSEAIRCLEKAHLLAPFYTSVVGVLAGLLARTGDERRAEELLAKVGTPETYGVPAAWAFFHVYRGETEEAVDWWGKVIDQRDPNAVISPRLGGNAALRTSPRWPALAKRMNLPESAW